MRADEQGLRCRPAATDPFLLNAAGPQTVAPTSSAGCPETQRPKGGSGWDDGHIDHPSHASGDSAMVSIGEESKKVAEETGLGYRSPQRKHGWGVPSAATIGSRATREPAAEATNNFPRSVSCGRALFGRHAFCVENGSSNLACRQSPATADHGWQITFRARVTRVTRP